MYCVSRKKKRNIDHDVFCSKKGKGEKKENIKAVIITNL